MQVITVKPGAAVGWVVQHEPHEPNVFLSGAKAERSARGIAARLAFLGQPAEVTVYLRDGSVGGRFTTRAMEGVANPNQA